MDCGVGDYGMGVILKLYVPDPASKVIASQGAAIEIANTDGAAVCSSVWPIS